LHSERFETINQLLETSFKRYRDLPAFTCLGHTMSFADVDQQSRRFASYLQNHTSLKPGDRIAIQLPNILQYPVVMYGALRAGLILVNTNPLYTPPELLHQLNDSGAKALVVLANVADRASEILAKTQVETVIVTEVGDMLPTLKRLAVNFVLRQIKKAVPPYHFPNSISFRDAMSKGDKPYNPVVAKPEDILVLQYTGGTTGVAKGAMLTQKNLAANVYQVLHHLPTLFKTHSQIAVAALPLYHIFAFNLHALSSFSRGAHNVLIPNPRDIKAFVKAIKPYKVSIFIAVNTLYNALARNEEFAKLDFSELKACAAGGMAVTEDVTKRWFKVTGCQICEGYGLTETSPVVITNPDTAIQPGTIGTLMIDTEAKIVNAANETLGDNEAGELWLRGPQVMLGYWQRPEATADALTADGWFKTGDIAVRRSDGYFKIVDRKKDMVLVSGFNVYPNEVEDVATQHPSIIEAAVIGVPCEESGEAVKIFVVTQDKNLTAEDVIQHCRKSLTAYKVPKQVAFIAELPKSNVGKILRRELRDMEMARTNSKVES
jgi:long-chain acyl-CoA synthetase